MGLFDALFRKGPRRVDLAKRFEKLAPVGHGSMSKVWKARDRDNGRLVALKVLDAEETRKLEARFPGLNKPTEGAIALAFDHPNVLKTFEHGLTSDGLQYLASEFVEGYPLSMYVEAQNAATKANRLRFMAELGDAVAHVHDKGYIDRDACPKNVIVTENLAIKLIDFGLCVPNTPPFKKPGNRTGTLNYMAPELIRRQPTDERIDVYSYAVTCFELCTKRLPREPAKTAEALMTALNAPPADVREFAPDLPEPAAAAIMRGLESDPRRRWSSAREMAAVFREAAG